MSGEEVGANIIHTHTHTRWHEVVEQRFLTVFYARCQKFFFCISQRISISPGDRGRTPDSKKLKKDDSDGERSDQVRETNVKIKDSFN